jgi:hypothetical protein
VTTTTSRPVFLHVGAMKTGTTFLQGLMFANRDALRDAGVLLPGGDFDAQVRGVREVLRLTHDDEHLQNRAAGSWQAITDEIARADHQGGLRVSVVSMEFLSFARRREVRRVLRSLAGREVHVVMTVRDTARLLPALWQTMVHSGSTLTWQELLDAVVAWQPGSRGLTDLTELTGRSPARGTSSVRSQLRQTADVPRMLRHWGSAVPRGRLHVVTVPRRGDDPTLLWRRFAGVVGVDPGVAAVPPPDPNASIGYASTELVRRVNLVLPPLSRSEYLGTMRAHLALTILARRRHLEARAEITAPAYEAALRANAAVHEAVQAAGAELVGDPDDLPVAPDPAHPASGIDLAPPPPDVEVLDAALLAVQGLQELRDRRLRRLRRRGSEVTAVEHPLPDGALARWEAEEDPVAAAVEEVAAWCHEVGLLVRERRRLKAAAADMMVP